MFVRREPGRGGKILSDHRQDGDDYEVHRLEVRLKKKKSHLLNVLTFSPLTGGCSEGLGAFRFFLCC